LLSYPDPEKGRVEVGVVLFGTPFQEFFCLGQESRVGLACEFFDLGFLKICCSLRSNPGSEKGLAEHGFDTVWFNPWP
jgi:hypothetical protein